MYLFNVKTNNTTYFMPLFGTAKHAESSVDIDEF